MFSNFAIHQKVQTRKIQRFLHRFFLFKSDVSKVLLAYPDAAYSTAIFEHFAQNFFLYILR